MRRFIRTILLSTALMTLVPLHGYGSVNRSISPARPAVSGGNFGLGFMLGDPTGLSAKYWMSGNTALSFGLASSWNNYLELFVDHDWHFSRAFSAPIVPYIGLGAGLYFDTYNRYSGDYYYRHAYFSGYTSSAFAFGIRVPLGIEFLPRTVPLGIFLEVTPGIALFPGVFGIIQAAIGIRYYF